METSANVSNSSSPQSHCALPKVRIGFSVWVVVYSLCTSLFLLVFYIAYKQWKKRRTGNFSHADVFTFNVILMEIIALIGSTVLTICLYVALLKTQTTDAAASLLYLNNFGQTFFQCLTCVDRYLAVVFPVAYLRLRKGGGVAIRNISIALVWLACIGHTVDLYFKNFTLEPISSILIVVLALAVVTFCCVSVLRVLIRPKPGEMDRTRVDRSKRRAFNTMVVILGVLLLKLMCDMLHYIISASMDVDNCLAVFSVLWFSLPSSLVLPLLFLYRAGTIKACTKKSLTDILVVRTA